MKYPLFKVHVPVEEALAEIRSVFESGFINEGVQVTALTGAMEKVLDAKNLILTNSCTSALTLALRLAGAKPGTSVVSTPMTCLASNTPIVNAGARLIWADIDPESGMIDPADVASKIRLNPRTVVAVVAVAWVGAPPDLEALSSVCRDHGVALILDLAHGFGAEYQGRQAHHFADYAAYSFQAIKHFTTGDGGALVCKDPKDHQRAKALKWFGIDRDAGKDAQGNWKGQQWDVGVPEAGYKFNLNNVSAAIGLAQLPYIAKILATHRSNAALYDDLFAKNDFICPATRPVGGKSSHWVYTVRVTDGNIDRDDLLARLNAEGIMAGVVHVPNDTYEAFAVSQVSLPGTRAFAKVQFSLPCGWWLTEEDVRHIAARVSTHASELSMRLGQYV